MAAAAGSEHGHAAAAGAPRTLTENVELGQSAWPVYNIAKVAGFVGIIGGVLLGYFMDPGFRRFYFAYLVSFAFFLSIALGALAFVLLQHLTRAGWSVNVRRVGECLAATMPILAALSAPIILSVLINRGDLYRWAQPVPQELQSSHGHGEAHGDTHSNVHGDAVDPKADAGHGKKAEPSGPHANTNPQDQHPATTAPGQRLAHPPADANEVRDKFAPTPVVHPSADGVPKIDALTYAKRPMLNRWTFTLRIIVYFVIWTAIALWYWRRSTEQDRTGEVELTERMQGFSAPALLILALTITFAAFDLLMSLDPHWFSTMFGVYFLSGGLLAAFASMILTIGLLQRIGYVTQSVTIEHYHDLGKWLFAFVFFWGYIAFSQYMLLWYANIPEETTWLAHRGATSRAVDINGWTNVAIALLLGKLLIPFAGLLSKHVKRRRPLLMFWAAWVLVFHWVDLFWIVMPELNGRVHFNVVEVLCFLGVGGIFFATFLRMLAKAPLRPLHDPRMHESLAFQNL